MQTFLPYPGFSDSASVLDRARLGKQRLEGITIFKTLLGESSGWKNHPAVRMWRGHEGALSEYIRAMCREWRARGYEDNIENILNDYSLVPESFAPPPWLGDPAFHASHRSNLLRKDPVHYGRFWWTEPPDLPYVWPVKS